MLLIHDAIREDFSPLILLLLFITAGVSNSDDTDFSFTQQLIAVTHTACKNKNNKLVLGGRSTVHVRR